METSQCDSNKETDRSGVSNQVDHGGQKAVPIQLVSTKNIVGRNLFDPERGAGQDRADKQAQANAVAMQRLRSMTLVGTIILGASRYAIVEDSGDPRLGPRAELTGQKGQMLRLKLGDMLEGFKVSAIEDRKVVFANGASKVEMGIDYLRKVDSGSPRGPGGAVPGAQPTVPEQPATPLAPRFPRRDARPG